MTHSINGGKEGILIATHSDRFHMDDVIACFMLQQIYPESTIIRTRDLEEIKKADMAVDVGGVYDPEKKRYDHHQRGFDEVYSRAHTIKLSSAGLVYKHHAEDFFRAIGLQMQGADVELLKSMLYDHYFASIDANDNGIEIAENVRYKERTLNDMVSAMCPPQSPGATYELKEAENFKAFKAAMEIMGLDLVRFCRKLESSITKSRPILERAYAKCGNNKYVVLDSPCIFNDMIGVYNRKYKKDVKIVIYPQSRQDNAVIYSILCMNRSGLRYTPEAPLLAKWRGLRDSELAKFPNLENAIFVHATGFCGSAKTLECAEYMVKESIKAAGR